MPIILGFVAAGLDLALLSACVQNLQRAGIVYRKLRFSTSGVKLAIAWRQGEEKRSPMLKAFLEVIRELARQTSA